MAGNNRLTWRDVAAPNFTGAGEMAARASNMLQQAVGGIGAGLEGFQDFQRDQAANYLARQTSQFTNPEALQAAMASGELFAGADPNKFSATDLNRVNGRVSSLLDQTSTRISNTNSQQVGARNQADYDRKEADRQWEEQYAGPINQATLKAGAGSATAMSQELANIPGITPARLNSILTGNMNYADKANRVATSMEQGNQAAINNRRGNEQFDGAQEGNRLFTDQVRNGLFDSIEGDSADKVNAFINTMPPGITKDTFVARASEQFPGMVKIQNNAVTSPTGKLAANIAPGDIPMAVGNAIYGQETNFGKDPNTNVVNSSNVTGPMQVAESTFNGMKKDGLIPMNYDWKNPTHNKDAGFKLVNSYAQKYNNDPAKMAAAYYGGPGAVNADGSINREWRDKKNPKAPTVGEYVDSVIGRMNKAGGAPVSTAGVTPASTAIAATVTGDQLREVNELSAINKNIAQLGLSNFTPRMLAAKQRDIELSKTGTSDTSSVATAAVGEDGPFAGMEKAELIKHMTDVQSKLEGISASEALEIVKDAQSDRWNRVMGVPVPIGANKPSVDGSRLEAIINNLTKGKYQKITKDGAYAQQGVDSATRDVKEWSDQVADLKKKYNDALSLGSRGAPAAATYLAQIATAQEGLNKALGLAGTVNQAAGFPGATSPIPSNARTAPPLQQQAPVLIEAKVSSPQSTPPVNFYSDEEVKKRTAAKTEADKLEADIRRQNSKGEVRQLQQKLVNLQNSTLNEGAKQAEIARTRKRIEELSK